MTTKICTKCGKEKELSEFGKRTDSECGYRSHCKGCISEQNKKWRNENIKIIKIKRVKSYIDNKDHINKQNNEWYANNKQRRINVGKEWKHNNIERHRAITRKSVNKRKRELGYNPLNKKFSGSVGHHINRNDVVYVPEELHKSIPHSQDDLVSMEEINTLAMEYI